MWRPPRPSARQPTSGRSLASSQRSSSRTQLPGSYGARDLLGGRPRHHRPVAGAQLTQSGTTTAHRSGTRSRPRRTPRPWTPLGLHGCTGRASVTGTDTLLRSWPRRYRGRLSGPSQAAAHYLNGRAALNGPRRGTVGRGWGWWYGELGGAERKRRVEADQINVAVPRHEGVPSSVELRRRPVVDQAALTSSS